MANSFPVCHPVEVSLQRAIELCKTNGGKARRHDQMIYIHVDKNGYVVTGSDHSAAFLAYDFETTWIYEPPKRSAFDKWNHSTPYTPQFSGKPRTDREEGRKEGWNAAIDEVLDIAVRLEMPLRDKYFEYWKKIQEIKEP